MTNNTFSDDNIQSTEDPMPETIKNFVAIEAVRVISDNSDKKKEKRK